MSQPNEPIYWEAWDHATMSAEVLVGYRVSVMGLIAPNDTQPLHEREETDNEFKKWLAEERRRAAVEAREQAAQEILADAQRVEQSIPSSTSRTIAIQARKAAAQIARGKEQ